MGGHIPALQQGKGCYFSTEKILGGELALYLLRLVAVSVPVKQVGAGGHLRGAKGGTEGSGLEVRSLHDSLVGGLVRRGSGGSTDDLVLLSTVGRVVTCRGEVWSLHDGLFGGPAGTYIIYHV